MDDRFEGILASQLAMNKETLAALQKHGVTQETELNLEFMYVAPNRDSAEGLVSFLSDETDYSIESRSEGLLRKKWFVQGTTQPTAISQNILDQWVKWMVVAGAEHACEFDGWGAQV